MVKIFCLTTALLVLTAAAIAAEPSVPDGQSAFSLEEYRWAVSWTNGQLESLMAHGIIESIYRDDSTFKILAGDAWSRLSFKQAGEILDKLARARQITGHSPFLTVEQNSTGTELGRVTWNSIEVLVPGEGYIEYFPDTPNRESTTY